MSKSLPFNTPCDMPCESGPFCSLKGLLMKHFLKSGVMFGNTSQHFSGNDDPFTERLILNISLAVMCCQEIPGTKIVWLEVRFSESKPVDFKDSEEDGEEG